MATNIISDATRWREISSKPQRLDELLGWLRSNGIDPHDIPTTATLTLEATSPEGALALRYMANLRNAEGRFYASDPDSETSGPACEERVTPLTVPPPAHWGVAPSPLVSEAVRDALITLGWTPPGEQTTPEPEDHGTVAPELGEKKDATPEPTP